jgi:2-haloacid dehalogenase
VPRPLSEFAVLSFDCYGTLIDWERGLTEALGPLWEANGQAPRREAEALRRFARLEPLQQAKAPGMAYEDVLTAVHRALAEALGLETSADLDEAFGASIPDWPAFPDRPAALRVLHAHYKLVILSNVSRAGIDASVQRLGVPFDRIITAEDVGSYKPDPANFRAMLACIHDELGVAPTEVLHVAQSLFHDHVPARALGLANVWIDRLRLAEGGDWGATAQLGAFPEIDYRFVTLAAFADAVGDAFP